MENPSSAGYTGELRVVEYISARAHVPEHCTAPEVKVSVGRGIVALSCGNV